MQVGDFLGLSYPTVRLVGRDYPTVLEQLLAARYTAQQPLVVNAGNPGESAGSSSALARFGTIAASRAYDVVLIMEGSNDIFGNPSNGGNVTAISPAIANLRSMVRDARGRGMRVFLATIPAVNPAGARGMTRYLAVPPLNAEIRLLASAEGVTLVDVFQVFNNNFSLLSVDGLHPNAEGFAQIARTFYDAIRSNLELTTLGTNTGGTAPLSTRDDWIH